jgi:hypothetical protein
MASSDRREAPERSEHRSLVGDDKRAGTTRQFTAMNTHSADATKRSLSLREVRAQVRRMRSADVQGTQ